MILRIRYFIRAFHNTMQELYVFQDQIRIKRDWTANISYCELELDAYLPDKPRTNPAAVVCIGMSHLCDDEFPVLLVPYL